MIIPKHPTYQQQYHVGHLERTRVRSHVTGFLSPTKTNMTYLEVKLSLTSNISTGSRLRFLGSELRSVPFVNPGMYPTLPCVKVDRVIQTGTKIMLLM